MTTKITVVTAVLNQAKALQRTIESVLAQSYPNLDYIIVDGASIDGTREVVDKYADRLTAWVSEPDNGVYDAMNKGWALAAPDGYVLYLGAGDRMLSLPEQIPTPGDLPVVYFGRILLNGGREFISYANWRLKLYNALHHQGLLVPKALHPDPPFLLEYSLYADFDFNQRLAKAGTLFKFCKELLCYAEPEGLTQQTNPDELQRIIRKNYGLFWSISSFGGYKVAQLVPSLRRLRPIH